jgi:hypothetical protein
VDGSSPSTSSGLALFPVLAILCGVAVGLVTVALAVVLVVRGRGAAIDEINEGDSAATAAAAAVVVDGCSVDGRGRYDAVSTKENDERRSVQQQQEQLYGERQLARCGEEIVLPICLA